MGKLLLILILFVIVHALATSSADQFMIDLAKIALASYE